MRRKVLATYKEVMAKVAASKKEDWILNHDETQRTYKGDLNIRIIDAPGEVLHDDSRFDEPWAQAFSSQYSPERRVFDIYYGSSFVRSVHTVAVDGFRVYIPFPRSADELVITDWEHRFAKVVQPPFDNLDSYLRRAGIQVK
jgi:hypothetical protein